MAFHKILNDINLLNCIYGPRPIAQVALHVNTFGRPCYNESVLVLDSSVVRSPARRTGDPGSSPGPGYLLMSKNQPTKYSFLFIYFFFLLLIFTFPNLGLTPPGLTTQMSVGQMPVGEHLSMGRNIRQVHKCGPL